LSEAEALSALASFGVTVPRALVADTADSAAAAADEIGGTVVVKAVAPGLFHKSEHRLVEVGVVGAEQALAAATRIEEAARAASIGSARFLVMEQVDAQLDVYVGFRRDPQFGATFVVGLGGVWTEFLHDVVLHVGDLDAHAARALVERSTVGAMMRGARGGALDVEGVVHTLVAIADLVAASPLVNAVDVNPLMVSRDRAVAVDAVIEIVPAAEEAFA
jgi:succinyl-CoA synthetase beta subunit